MSSRGWPRPSTVEARGDRGRVTESSATDTEATYLSDGAIELTRRIEAPPETVFRYFTDPERYRAWLGVDAELDPSVGVDYRSQMTDNGGSNARGRYVVMDPPHGM